MTWEQAWQEGRTRWDTGQAAPALVHLLEEDLLPKGRALVPGAGAGYDVCAIAAYGYQVLALDLAPTAGKRFEEVRSLSGLTAEQASLQIGDFFSFETDEPFDVIWDYTFLCAIPPELREAWVNKMKELLHDDGELVTLIFPVREDDGEGPPFAMSPDLVRDLVTPDFEQVYLEPVTCSHPARMGKEWLARWKKAR